MGWGTSWDKPKIEWPKKAIDELLKETPIFSGVDLGAGDSQTILTTFEDGQLKSRIVTTKELYNNKFPTHDPYTNPNAFLYYECECGERLDPRTKSFASLNNAASNANWKVRWGPNSYVPYCPKCVEEKGIE